MSKEINTFPTVLHAIASHAKTISDKDAIIEAETDRRCTYGALWAYVKAFSKRLAAAGVVPDYGDGYGTRVVVRCTQTIDFVVALLAVELAGGVFVPVEKNVAEARIIEIMTETDSPILVSMKPLSGYPCAHIPLTDATAETSRVDESDIILPASDTLADIIFTTGTTGKSKGVMQTHKAYEAYFLSIYSALRHDDQQVWLNPAPLSHLNGFNKTGLSLYFQCTTVLLDGYMFAKDFFSAIKKYRVTVLNLLYAATQMYLRTYRNNLLEIRDQIKYIALGSSSFSEEQITMLKEIFSKASIIQTYAASEVTGCYLDHARRTYPPLCLGEPFDNTKVVFFDESKNNMVETNSNAYGLFGLDNDSKMLGYWKNPELTKSIIRGDYLILSDLGYKGRDGLYYFVGRADDIITSGAYKIAPLEIEDAANAIEGIAESVCVAVEDPIMGEVPKLYVVMEDGYDFNFIEIHKQLKKRLESSRVPRYIEEIDRIPKINNKINRKELRYK